MKKSKKRMLPMILLLTLVLAFSMTACTKNEDGAGARTDGQAVSSAVTESVAESEPAGILEAEGDIVIEVPEDEETFGE